MLKIRVEIVWTSLFLIMYKHNFYKVNVSDQIDLTGQTKIGWKISGDWLFS